MLNPRNLRKIVNCSNVTDGYSIYALFSFMMAIVLMYQEITQHQEKSFVRTQLEVFIRNVCFLSIAIPFCSSCYTNLIVSLTFRKEVKKALSRTRFCL